MLSWRNRPFFSFLFLKMGLDVRKPVFWVLRTIKAQITDQHLYYSLCRKYYISICYKRNFNFLASLSGWGDWFESRFVGNPEDRFRRDEAQIKTVFTSYAMKIFYVACCEAQILNLSDILENKIVKNCFSINIFAKEYILH